MRGMPIESHPPGLAERLDRQSHARILSGLKPFAILHTYTLELRFFK